MILNFFASDYLPDLPFGAIVTLGPHDAGCTLKLQMQLHWLALYLIVVDGLGDENIAQLQFGMWLVALPPQGDYDAPSPNYDCMVDAFA